MKRLYIDGHRSLIRCPKCKKIFFNRRFKACPYCKVGLKFGSEFVYEGDFYYSDHEWITYQDLLKKKV